MTSENEKWKKLRDNYLKQVEDALASIGHPKNLDILKDVECHLEAKFCELTPEQQNWEGYQNILIEMGPPQDYAELLIGDKLPQKGSSYVFNAFLAVVFIIVLAAVGSYLVYSTKTKPPKQTVTKTVEMEKSPVEESEFDSDKQIKTSPAAFVVVFRSVFPQLRTARQLLDAFNQHHPSGVRTHHYRTRIEDDQLIGYICVDNEPAVDTIRAMLEQNEGLKFIGFESVTQEAFEKHCLQKQVSLPLSIEQSKPLKNESIQIIETAVIPEPTVLGKWFAVDCVKNIGDFKPNQRTYKKTFILKELHFTSDQTVYWNFNSDVVKQTSFNDDIVETVNGHQAKSFINTIDGQDYLFVEWITPGVIKEEKEPDYYVLRRQEEFYVSEEQPAINAHVINMNPVGRWISVDFVKNIADFRPGEKQWTYDLYLKDLTFFENGNTSGPWTWRQNYLWHPGDRTQSYLTIQQMQGSLYLFMEWMSGDVTIRGQKPKYYVLKKTTNSKRLANTSRGSNFTLGASYCTANYVRSVLGPPKRVDSGGRMLRYSDDGIDFWFSNNGPLSEVHLNRGYNGKLETGVSLASSKQEVFATYGQPGRVVQTDKLSGRNDERILYQNGNTSRIYYGRHGLIFWFRDNAINQIVVFKGRFDVDRL